MKSIEFVVPKHLEPFINCIMVGESKDTTAHKNIPLYADGYPGIMFQQAENGFYLLPKNKKLSELFLYGQTLDPISLDVKGPYRFIVFQLYPFASKYLLGIDPRVLNDDCFDLLQLEHIGIEAFHRSLKDEKELEEQINIISDLMLILIESHQITPDDRIQKAINIILQHEGQITVNQLLEQLPITERTLERNFLTEIGLTPKQFAKIVQFQCSLHKLNRANFNKLVEVGIDSGFSDQSHFIRTFKKYTGQTPSYYLNQMAK
ncbi:helix-turn-helix transcriptional regulator [Xanthovirga aplysinae]|uniref:helix-turn-helix transcriptional regulator n=1 Tax=Xanthovirga aplysinae TaxID=2529853 RepID=UPI0012BC29A5|nr:helix-turn-helix transcriptional regulator [Xanthovirga aplysinae]MTI31822.1 AraC family transcriptional regulator [Xanthovirga aplysinae]